MIIGCQALILKTSDGGDKRDESPPPATAGVPVGFDGNAQSSVRTDASHLAPGGTFYLPQITYHRGGGYFKIIRFLLNLAETGLSVTHTHPNGDSCRLFDC